MACQRDLLILPEERAWYQMLMSTGLTDTYRLFYPKVMMSLAGLIIAHEDLRIRLSVGYALTIFYVQIL